MALEPTQTCERPDVAPRRLGQPERPTGWKPHGIFLGAGQPSAAGSQGRVGASGSYQVEQNQSQEAA